MYTEPTQISVHTQILKNGYSGNLQIISILLSLLINSFTTFLIINSKAMLLNIQEQRNQHGCVELADGGRHSSKPCGRDFTVKQ